MQSLALFDALQDFARPGRSGPPSGPVEIPRADPAPAAQKPIDIEAIVARRVAEAEAALREKLGAEQAAALVALAEEHEESLAELHRGYGETVGRTVAAAIAEAETRITGFAVASMARAVGGILSDDLQKRSMQALATAIRDAMADREAVRIRVRGPQFLFEALHSALGEHAAKLDFAETPGFDLTVSIDGNPIETRLSEWSAGLSEILA